MTAPHLTGLAVTSQVYPSTAGAAPAALILAHGAGAGQFHPFMTRFASAIAAFGIDVVTFNFPYMDGKRRVPDKAPVLEECYRGVIAATRRDLPSGSRKLFIGGKSMGGRMATHVAAADADLPVAGLVLLGYPLHPPGNPARRRDAHLPRVGRPALFVQGSRDTFGTPEELGPVLASLVPAPTLHVVEGGDHSFKVARGEPTRQAQIEAEVQRTVAAWIHAIAH